MNVKFVNMFVDKAVAHPKSQTNLIMRGSGGKAAFFNPVRVWHKDNIILEFGLIGACR